MPVNADNLPESWLTLLGGRDASGWLAAFAALPERAVNDLLWDAFYFGPLNLTERGQLLVGWLDLLDNSEQFAERLDRELSHWVEKNWGRFDHSAESLASAWSCLCSVVEYSGKLSTESRLKKCASALRARFSDRRQFLGSFSTAPAADPLGRYLAVVAEFQGDDRSLAAFWHRMCDLPDGVPFYHARYAMLGLRRLKAADPAENGTLRAEIVLGLLRLARAFDRLAEDQVLRKPGLPERIAKATFRRVASQTAAAYPKSPRWRAHNWAELVEVPERAQRWLQEAVPALLHTSAVVRPRKSIEPDRTWPQRARDLAIQLKSGNHKSLASATELLNEQRQYAAVTGDTYFVVRTLCNFASRVMRFNSQLALRWAEEARGLEPDNGFTWSTVRTILLHQQRPKEALRLAWVARKLFPGDDVTRNGLAEVLKAVHRYDEAEQVYRETIEQFPNDVFARSGLAEVLKAIHRYDEAERVYRETIERFPANVVARSGLADILRRLRRWSEAESVYRQSIALGLADQATFCGLAYLVLQKGEAGRVEALELLKQALEVDPYSRHARELKRRLTSDTNVNLKELADEWDKITEASFDSPIALAEEEEAWLENWDDTSEAALRSESERPRLSIEPEAPLESITPTERKGTEVGELRAKPHPKFIRVSEPSTLSSADEPDDQQRAIQSVQSETLTESVAPQKVGTTESDKSGASPQTELHPPSKQLEPSLATEPRAIGDQTKGEQAFKQSEPSRATEPSGTHPVKITSNYRLQSDSLLLAALVAEAYFYRKWARGAEEEVAARRRWKASQLIDKAEHLAPQDPQVLAERAALNVDEGNEEVAYQTLTNQLDSRRAAVPLLVLKARLDRERAYKESRPLNDATLAELCDVSQRLYELNEALSPLSHFQKGLASLALRDGSARLEAAARSFTRFRHTVAYRADEEKKKRALARDPRGREVPRFHEWIQQQTNKKFFAALTESEEVHPADIPMIENTLWQRYDEVMEIEDILADRIACSIV